MSLVAEMPCQECGWKFKTFHICLGLPHHIMKRVEDGGKRPRSVINTDTKSGPKPKRDPYKTERNLEIIRLYSDEDMTIREISASMKLDQKTIMTVLHRAADRGDVVIRRAIRRTSRF